MKKQISIIYGSITFLLISVAVNVFADVSSPSHTGIWKGTLKDFDTGAECSAYIHLREAGWKLVVFYSFVICKSVTWELSRKEFERREDGYLYTGNYKVGEYGKKLFLFGVFDDPLILIENMVDDQASFKILGEFRDDQGKMHSRYVLGYLSRKNPY